tara:strand:+ start:295 stop:807 length:513 start_codon:yes stop_codon:yes gene_type:complete
MTEDTMQEFGTHVGQVVRFFNRKGFGFIKDLNDDKDYFVHNTEISLKDNGYRKLYPGEYVSYNIIDKNGKQVCTGVRGIMGFPLLTENADHVYRVYPKNNGLSREDTPRYQPINSGDSSDSDSESDGSEEEEGSKEEEEPTKEKEFINKEVPEGIEVAEFDGLNINEEMC